MATSSPPVMRQNPSTVFSPVRLWRLVNGGGHIAALGALTGNQAVQMAQAGPKAIYQSGWQVAADANTGGQMYPDRCGLP